MKYLILCFLFFTVSARAHTTSFTNAKTTSHGSDQANNLCEKFNLTNNETLKFFKRSKEVDAVKMHSEYDYLPCYVKGTISANHDKTTKNCKFTIRAGGTAELTCPSEEAKFFACNTCDNLLRVKL